MSLKDSYKRFARFYLGLANEKEKQEVFHSTESETMLSQQWENSSELKDKGEVFDRAGVFSKIQKQISINETKNKQFSLNTFIRRYAAILVIGLIVTGSIVVFSLFKFNASRSYELVEFTNPKTEKAELILPDGSKIVLNAKSTIKYPRTFPETNRTISLLGEAYLEVVSDTTKVFIIKTSNVDIEVLGTTFNVMAYPDDNVVETTLLTGKVKINRFNPKTKKSQSVILTPNHKATFYVDEERFIMDKVDVNISTSWKRGVLIFDNEPFESVVKKLERRFDVNIKLSDNIINKYRYTMSIENESIEDVLEIIKKTSPVNYTKVNGEIVFYSTK